MGMGLKKFVDMGLALTLFLFFLLPSAVVAQQPPPQPAAPAPAPPDSSGPLMNEQTRAQLRSGMVTLNYENLDIRLLARLMAEFTGRNIVMDQNVQGRISVMSSAPVNPDQAWDIFRIALERYGMGVVEANGVTQILPLKDIRKYAPVIKNPTNVRSGMSVAVLVFKNADVNQMQNALRPLLSDLGDLQPYFPAKAIVVTDRSPMVERIAATARYLDQAHSDTMVSVNFPKYAEATEIAPILEELINPPGVPNEKRTVVRAFAPSNAVMIYGEPANIAKVKAMLARIDVEEAAPEDVQEPRFYVIALQNAKAEEVAAILSEMLTEKADLQQQRLQNNPRLARQQRAASNASTPDANSAPATDAEGDRAAPGEDMPFVSSKVAADVETNSLVFYISPSQFVEVEALVEKLDAPRKQVLVTAVVAEVTLSRLLETGANFQVLTPGGVISAFNGGVSEEGLLSFLASGNFFVGAAGAGTRTININGRDVNVPEAFGFIKAEQNNSDFNLISAPRVLTEDHKQAEINVGNVVPFPTGAQFNAFGQPTVTYDYRDVGIKMLVTPHVSQSDTIKLEIEQEVQEVTGFLEQNLGGTGFTVPLISNRNVKTTITVRDGQTLLIGGLISKRTTETLRKVPILGDIPLIQNLFRELRKEEAKTTLFISLTPHIVTAPEEIDRIDRPYRKYLEGDRNPADAQVEKRPTRPEFRSPYEQQNGDGGIDLSGSSSSSSGRSSSTMSRNSSGAVMLEGFRLLETPVVNGRSRSAVTIANGGTSSDELVVIGTVRHPDGSRRELRGDSIIVPAGGEAEVTLPSIEFDSGKGVYEVDLAVWENDRLRGRLRLPERIEVK
jgi:general secretion pathway protein D